MKATITFITVLSAASSTAHAQDERDPWMLEARLGAGVDTNQSRSQTGADPAALGRVGAFVRGDIVKALSLAFDGTFTDRISDAPTEGEARLRLAWTTKLLADLDLVVASRTAYSRTLEVFLVGTLLDTAQVRTELSETLEANLRLRPIRTFDIEGGVEVTGLDTDGIEDNEMLAFGPRLSLRLVPTHWLSLRAGYGFDVRLFNDLIGFNSLGEQIVPQDMRSLTVQRFRGTLRVHPFEALGFDLRGTFELINDNVRLSYDGTRRELRFDAFTTLLQPFVFQAGVIVSQRDYSDRATVLGAITSERWWSGVFDVELWFTEQLGIALHTSVEHASAQPTQEGFMRWVILAGPAGRLSL